MFRCIADCAGVIIECGMWNACPALVVVECGWSSGGSMRAKIARSSFAIRAKSLKYFRIDQAVRTAPKASKNRAAIDI